MDNQHSQIVAITEPEPPVPLRRITPRGSVQLAFWGLRVYIVGMLILVAIGFSRGLH